MAMGATRLADLNITGGAHEPTNDWVDWRDCTFVVEDKFLGSLKMYKDCFQHSAPQEHSLRPRSGP